MRSLLIFVWLLNINPTEFVFYLKLKSIIYKIIGQQYKKSFMVRSTKNMHTLFNNKSNNLANQESAMNYFAEAFGLTVGRLSTDNQN